MRTLYDVQQLLKRFGIYVYVGSRIADIELMAIELQDLHQAGLVNDQEYKVAKLILRREHRIEEERNKGICDE